MTIPDQSPGPLDLLHPSMIAILRIRIDTFEIADENLGDLRQHTSVLDISEWEQSTRYARNGPTSSDHLSTR